MAVIRSELFALFPELITYSGDPSDRRQAGPGGRDQAPGGL